MTKQEQIKAALHAAMEAEQNEMRCISFERLHFAVSLIAERLDEIDRTASRALNEASCLANGINPD